MRPIRRTKSWRGAFSLLELLVVIGIIVLLIAVLLPALGAFCRHARSILCMNNLRSHSQAINAYLSDHSDPLLPLAHFRTDLPAGEPGMYGPLADYFTVPLPRVFEDGTVELLPPYHCPLDTQVAAHAGASYTYIVGYFMADYGMADAPNPARQREITAPYEEYPDTPLVSDAGYRGEHRHLAGGKRGEYVVYMDGNVKFKACFRAR